MKIFSKLSSREKRLLTFTLAVLSSVGLYLYVIEPLWNYWVGLDSTITDCQDKLRRSQNILRREKSIVKTFKKYEKKLKIEGSDQTKTAQILKEIETTARNNQFNINDIKPQNIRDREFYKFYLIELEAEADIMSLAKFIYDLQISQQSLRVSRLQLAASSSNPHLLKVEMIITKVILQ